MIEAQLLELVKDKKLCPNISREKRKEKFEIIWKQYKEYIKCNDTIFDFNSAFVLKDSTDECETWELVNYITGELTEAIIEYTIDNKDNKDKENKEKEILLVNDKIHFINRTVRLSNSLQCLHYANIIFDIETKKINKEEQMAKYMQYVAKFLSTSPSYKTFSPNITEKHRKFLFEAFWKDYSSKIKGYDPILAKTSVFSLLKSDEYSEMWTLHNFINGSVVYPVTEMIIGVNENDEFIKPVLLDKDFKLPETMRMMEIDPNDPCASFVKVIKREEMNVQIAIRDEANTVIVLSAIGTPFRVGIDISN
jgi:hypothetical protein